LTFVFWLHPNQNRIPTLTLPIRTPKKSREKILDRIRVRLLRTEGEGMMVGTTGIEPVTRDDLPIGIGVFGRCRIALMAAVMLVMP